MKPIPSTLAMALVLSVAGCSTDTPEPPGGTQVLEAPSISTEGEAETQSPAALQEPLLESSGEPAIALFPETGGNAGGTADPMALVVDHAALDITVHAELTSDALEVQESHGQTWARVKEGSPLSVCVTNRADTAVLVSLAIQGQDIDFQPAHPTRNMWRVGAQAAQCIESTPKDKTKPAVVAWNAYFVSGDQGTQIDPSTAKVADAGFVRLGTPSDTHVPNAWTALAPDEDAEPETSNNSQATGQDGTP